MKQYQELLLPSGSVPGERLCAERWELIRRYVPPKGVVLDVGSNLGYFALRAAQTSPDVAVVSLESDGEAVRTQRRVMASHRMRRVCVLHGHLTAEVTTRWRETCDWFDLVLLLAVVHWLDDPEAVVADLAHLGGRLIVELPDHRDAGACGQDKISRWPDPVAWLAETTGRSCRLIGRPDRHTSGFPSHLVLVEGPVERRPSRAYWGSDHRHPEGNAYRIAFDGARLDLSVRGRRVDYVSGVNLVTLMQLGGLKWPPAGWWLRRGIRRIAGANGHLDPMPHNVLWTPNGLHLIDGADVMVEAGRLGGVVTLARSVWQWSRGRTVDTSALAPPQRTWRRAVRDRLVLTARRRLPWPVYRLLRGVGRRTVAVARREPDRSRDDRSTQP